jgi:hypothetical protein
MMFSADIHSRTFLHISYTPRIEQRACLLFRTGLPNTVDVLPNETPRKACLATTGYQGLTSPLARLYRGKTALAVSAAVGCWALLSFSTLEMKSGYYGDSKRE